MSSTYLCKKCNLKTGHYTDLKKHLCKKKQCAKNLEALKYSDDQLLVLTLLPYFNDKHIIDLKEIIFLKESSIIYKNKDRLFNILENIDKNKLKKCIYCSNEFSKYHDLRKHILISCFYTELEKEHKIIKGSLINGNNNSLIINNITNNIYLDIKRPIPFDEEWDISNIDNMTRSGVIMSKFMYTALLEEILKNEINLNIIIDKDDEIGIVYKNDIDKYINMKSKDIVQNTMDKLNKHLLDINKADESCYDFAVDYSRKMIKKKHADYITDPIINSNVKNCITNIFVNKKNEAINISKNIQNSHIDSQKGF